MNREAMKQIAVALRALMTGYMGDAEDAIDAIEKELAKPEQEPVRWFQQFGDSSPRKEWVGLKDHDIELTFLISGFTAKNFAHAIEAKLKELNT